MALLTPAGMKPKPPEKAKSDYPWLDFRVRRILVAHCILAFGFQITFAVEDLTQYAVDLPGALSVLFWLLSAGLAVVAAVALAMKWPWFAPPLLIAETLIALAALYVLWADFSSPLADTALRWTALEMLLVALFVVPTLAVKLTLLPGRAWAGGLALISALGLTQFSVENFIVPSRSAPVLEISAALQDAGTSGDTTHVRGVITIKNAGKASMWLPQAIASVEASTGGSGTAAPLDPQAVVTTFNPVVADGVAYSRALPEGDASGTIWMDDLSSVQNILPPGLTHRREFMIDVSRKQVRHLELRLDVSAVTNARWENARTCDRKTTALDGNFRDAFRRILTQDTRQGRWTFSCLQVPFRGRNFVRHLTDDSPMVQLGYAFTAPSERPVGAFFAYWSQEDDHTDPFRTQRASDRIQRRNPTLVVTTTADLALPLTTPADAGAQGKPGS